VTQDVGPEFKLQYKKEKEKEILSEILSQSLAPVTKDSHLAPPPKGFTTSQHCQSED
jgi:hypothetical protein